MQKATLNIRIAWLLNAAAFMALGILFTLPWLFTNDEIAANVANFWLGGK